MRIPTKFLTIAIIMLLYTLPPAAVSAAAYPGDDHAQRELFQQAWQAAQANQMPKVRQLMPQLEGYPLHAYLLYRELRLFHPGKLQQAIRFLRDYPMFPHRKRMRDDWIHALAQRNLWQELLQLAANRADTGSVSSRCLVLTARLRVGHKSDFLQQAMPLFLQGKSQPKQCDPVFAELYRTVSSDIIWQRVQLAIAENQIGLARHLGRYLDANGKAMLQSWLLMHEAPTRGLATLPAHDTVNTRLLAMHGIRRLTSVRGINRALRELERLERMYSFTSEEIYPVLSYMGKEAVRKKHPDAINILKRIQIADAETFSWQLVAALRSNSWQELLHWTAGQNTDEDISPLQRSYWHARALIETGYPQDATVILEQLAQQRDYYGFLAADLINKPYRMEARKVPDDLNELTRVEAIPVISRSREWLLLGQTKLASREWVQARKHLDPVTLEYAAQLSYQWGWHYGAVLALGAAKSFDILELRFPLLYRQELSQAAMQHDLDSGWLYGLVRSESVFVEDIRSPAGALGLMQVMPATGAYVARKIGLKGYSSNMLLAAKYNVLLGSSYLKQMYDMFNGNVIYATAAYNAGPHRVARWDERTPCTAADIWIETIPFKETKQYVKRVLSYSSIYDWLLQQEIVPIKERIGVHWQRTTSNCVASVL